MTDLGLQNKSALLIGLGGLGCPAALVLARAGVGRLVLCDDDHVDVTNLHRQILYSDADVGRDKLEAARETLLKEGPCEVKLERKRLLPENAQALVSDQDVVLEGADNFATKFLAADACHLSGTPIVHGAAVRFSGTAWSVSAQGAPCYRCLFEDLLPEDDAPNCTSAGVFGPLVGVVGALMGDLALDELLGRADRRGAVFTIDGKRELIRRVDVSPRPECPLCGTPEDDLKIKQISRPFYTSPEPLKARLNQLNA